MKPAKPIENPDLKRLQIFFYLVPVIGFFPAVWTLYRQTGGKERQALSRLVVTLAFTWLVGYMLLETGAQTSESLAIPLWLLSTGLTSGYFLTNFWLMLRLWKRQPVRLPGFSALSDRLP